MPKVGTIRIDNANRAGVRITFKGDVHVDGAGVFKLALSDEDIARNAEKILYNPCALSDCVVTSDGYVSVGSDTTVERKAHSELCKAAREITYTYEGYHQQKYPTLRAYTFAALEEFMKYVVACSNALTVTEEYVLLYRFESKWHCYVTATGEVLPNGEGDQEQAGKWRGTEKTSFAGDDAVTYRAGFGAGVYVKKTRIKGAVRQVDYDFITSTDSNVGENGRMLRKFNQLNMLVDEKWGSAGRGELPRGVVEMPYTEEAAAFFCKVLLAMCKLCNSLEDYLGTPEKVATAITANKLSLPQV